jgi:hypothetical protein
VIIYSFVVSPFLINEISLYSYTVDVGKLSNHVNFVFLLSFFFSLNIISRLFYLIEVCERFVTFRTTISMPHKQVSQNPYKKPKTEVPRDYMDPWRLGCRTRTIK